MNVMKSIFLPFRGLLATNGGSQILKVYVVFNLIVSLFAWLACFRYIEIEYDGEPL